MRKPKEALGYHIIKLVVNSAHYHVPQNRRRLYIIGFRQAATRGSAAQAHSAILDLMDSFQGKPGVPWGEWLNKRGLPLMARDADGERYTPAQPCLRCGEGRPCRLHVCGCQICHQRAATSLRPSPACAWRGHKQRFRASHKKQAADYTRRWRKVRPDKALKAAPSFWDLAQKMDLRVPIELSRSPRMRNLMAEHSRIRNVMNPNSILDISQAVHRTAYREDGLVPTLTTTCSHLFAPAAGVFLSPDQCIALQGFNPLQLPLECCSDKNLYKMAGMTMSAPVVGAVMCAVVSQLRPE